MIWRNQALRIALRCTKALRPMGTNKGQRRDESRKNERNGRLLRIEVIAER